MQFFSVEEKNGGTSINQHFLTNEEEYDKEEKAGVINGGYF